MTIFNVLFCFFSFCQKNYFILYITCIHLSFHVSLKKHAFTISHCRLCQDSATKFSNYTSIFTLVTVHLQRLLIGTDGEVPVSYRAMNTSLKWIVGDDGGVGCHGYAGGGM